MKNSILTVLLCLICSISFCQRFQAELLTGVSNYQGDLLPIPFTFRQSQPAFNANIKYQLDNHFYIRAGIGAGSIQADDKKNRDYLQPRNLNFHSSVAEVNAGIEYDVLNVEKFRITPYFFTGIGIFHFNPYTLDENRQRVYLQPLSTEGQGLAEYPSRKPYRLTQPCIPLVFGIKYAPCINLQISYEFGFRKTFFDYLDDVSQYYIDYEVLLNRRGMQAVDVSYRGDELPSGDERYPLEGTIRGNPNLMDWYYFTGVKICLRLNAGGICTRDKTSWKDYLPYRKNRCPIKVW